MQRGKENGQRGFLSRLRTSSGSNIQQQPQQRAGSPARGGDAAPPPKARATTPLSARGRRADGAPQQLAAAGSRPQSRSPLSGAGTPRGVRPAGPQPSGLRLPCGSASGPAPSGSLTARRVPKAPDGGSLLSPRGPATYRDVVCNTPRQAGSNIPAPPPPSNQAAAPQLAGPHELGDRQQQRLLLMQQQARASHEQEQVTQQISRLEAGMAAQQAELQGRLAALAALRQRREALADHASRLSHLCAQAKAAEERQSAELAGLELMLQALEAGLEGHKLQATENAAKAAAARAALLGMMQTAAAALGLGLGSLAASLQQELAQRPRSGTHARRGAAAAAAPQQQAQQARRAACPRSPSDAGSQGYATPSGSVGGGDSSSDDEAGSTSSSEAGSPRASSGSGVAGEITARFDPPTSAQPDQPPASRALLPKLQLGSLPQAAGGGAAPCSARAPPSSRIPGVALVSPLAAAAAAAEQEQPGNGVAPQVLLRLQVIGSKLEAALADQALEL